MLSVALTEGQLLQNREREIKKTKKTGLVMAERINEVTDVRGRGTKVLCYDC